MAVEIDRLHPGQVLSTLYLEPLAMSAGTLAKRLNVPRTRIERVVKGETSLTTDTALRLSRFFGTTPEYWMNLQTGHDLQVEAKASAHELAGIERLAMAD